MATLVASQLVAHCAGMLRLGKCDTLQESSRGKSMMFCQVAVHHGKLRHLGLVQHTLQFFLHDRKAF